MSLDLDLSERPHSVYVFWNGEECLYVGMTANPLARLAAHRGSMLNKSATHIDVWDLGCNRAEAERIEAEAIRALDPKWNTYLSPRVDRRRAALADYDEWRDALRRSRFEPSYEWARDPGVGVPICTAIGKDFAEVVAWEAAEWADAWARMQRALTFVT